MEKLTLSMHEIGRLSQKETIAMRIITVVTLIFLPATFVSVSNKNHCCIPQSPNRCTDLLQYRHYKVPEWRSQRDVL